MVTAREPGGTALGERIRELVLHGDEMTPWAEALLYAAARAELVAEVIAPALERGADVLLDRYLDSSVAYQGVGRGLGLDEVLELNLHAVGGLLPDRTFVLAVDAGTSRGARRRRARTGSSASADAFHAARRRGVRASSPRCFPERIVVLDGTARPRDSRRPDRAMSFAGLPEQPEAKRLLAAALAEGPAHAYLLHGPAGVGKRAAARAFAAALLGDERARRGRDAPRPLRARAARRDDPDRRDARAPSRPAHASVRGGPARLRDLRTRTC